MYGMDQNNNEIMRENPKLTPRANDQVLGYTVDRNGIAEISDDTQMSLFTVARPYRARHRRLMSGINRQA